MTGDRSADLDRIVASAARLGVELDEADALQWLAAVAAARAEQGDISVDEATGVFGHRVTMLDFSSVCSETGHGGRTGSGPVKAGRPGAGTGARRAAAAAGVPRPPRSNSRGRQIDRDPSTRLR